MRSTVESVRRFNHHAGMVGNDKKEPPFDVTTELRELRVRAGLSKAQMARDAGYASASGVQRYEDPNLFTKKYVRYEVADKLCKALVGKGKPPITSNEVYALAGKDMMSLDDSRSERLPIDQGTETQQDIPVVGAVSAGNWLEADAMDEVDRTPIPISPHSKYPAKAQFALRVSGQSVNRIAQDGHYLICVDLERAQIVPQSGDLVIVERTDRNTGRREVTARRLVTDIDGNSVLKSESDDSRWQAPIPYMNGSDTADIIKITAKVLFSANLPT